MTWNYRIIKDAKYGHYILTECYYGKDGEIEGWTDTEGKGHAPWGENPQEICKVLEMMLQACERPVLDEAELLRKFEESEK